MTKKPEPPHGLLAQLEYVREQIELLAGMVTGAEVLMTVAELDEAWHLLNRLRKHDLSDIQRNVYEAMRAVTEREDTK